MESKMTKAEKDRRKAAEQKAKAKKKKETGKSSSSSKLSQLVKNAIGGQKEKKTFTEAFEDNTKKLPSTIASEKKTRKAEQERRKSVAENAAAKADKNKRFSVDDERRYNPLTKTGVRMPERDVRAGNLGRTREELERRTSTRDLAQMSDEDWLRKSRESVALKENEKAGVGLGTIQHGTLNKNAELFSDNWDRIPKENQTDASIQIIYTYGVNDQNRDMVMTAFNNASTYDKRKIMDAVVQTDGWSDVAREMRQTINNAPDENQALMQQISEDMNVRNGNYLDTFQRAAGKAQVDQYNLQQKEDKVIADWAKENYDTAEAFKYRTLESGGRFVNGLIDSVAFGVSDLLQAGQQDNLLDGINPVEGIGDIQGFGNKIAKLSTNVLHDLFRLAGISVSVFSKTYFSQDDVDDIVDRLTSITEPYHEAVRNNMIAMENANMSQAEKDLIEVYGMVIEQIPNIVMSVVATPAAGLATTGATAGGLYARSAYEQGATLEQAVQFGLTGAAAEVATEKLFTGFGYFGKGLSSKILTDTTRKMLDNSAFKDSMSARILKRVVAGGGEATEEMIMELVQPYLERSTYDPTADGATLEEILRSGGLGFVVAQILGLPANALGVTADVMQKYDANMREKTLQENINAVIAEELESGRITEEQAANINAQIKDIRKGKGVLTQSEAKEETKVTGENLDTVYDTYEEAKNAMIKEARTKADGEKITANYIENGEVKTFTATAKDGVLGLGRSELAAPKYQKIAKATNITERTGYQLNVKDEIVKEVSALSKAFNREVEFYYDENSAVHGNVDLNTGKIYVNVNSSQSPAAAVIAHEMTHLLENTSSYKTLTNMMQKYYASSLEDKRNEIIAIYESNPEAMKTILDKDGEIKMDVIDSEVMAAFIEEKLLTDYNTIRELTRTERTLAQKIVDWLNKVIQKITGSKEQKFLMEARDVWRKALAENKKAPADGVKYSAGLQGKRRTKSNIIRSITDAEKKRINGKVLARIENLKRKEGFVGGMFSIQDGGYIYYCIATDMKSYAYTILGKKLLIRANVIDMMEAGYGDYTETTRNGSNAQGKRSFRRGERSGDRFIGRAGRTRTALGMDEAEENIHLQRDDGRGSENHNVNNSIDKMQDESSASFNLQKRDREYINAVKRGDMNTARKMVEKAAEDAGYIYKMFHGSKGGGGFTVFRNWQYFTENKSYAERYGKRDVPESLYSVYIRMDKPFDTRDQEAWEHYDDMRIEYGLSDLQSDGLPDWTDGYDITEYIDENDLDYDSVLLNEGGDFVDGKHVSRGISYVIRDSSQVKSAEIVSYDDSGEIIPLSERFKPYKNDIRYSIGASEDAEYMDAVNRGDMETAQRMVDEAAEMLFPNSKVRDDNGKMRKVFHGTVNEFTVFDRQFANIEGDFGKGYYFTSNENDVDANYANEEGADLKNKIALYAERLGWDDEYSDLSYAEREEIARQKFITSEPNTIEAYLNMQNPVYINPDENGTFLDYEETYDEEYDEYGEPEGLLVDFIEALNDIAAEYSYGDVDFDFLYEYGYDGGMHASDAVGVIKRRIIDELADEDGDLAVNEVIRRAFEEIGFDGIIDSSVFFKFRNMPGMTRDTTHYIVFDSNQIKSADPVTYDDEGNVIPLSERFNPAEDDIRWSVGKSSKTELNDLIKAHGTAMREVFHNRKRADHKELWDMIKDEVSHIVQTGAARRDVVDEIVRLAYETGYINNAVESEELGENTWGKGIYIPEEYKGEMASLGGLRSINGQLRNSGLFLTYNRTKKGSDEKYGGLDEAYSDLQASNPILPETTDPAEQVEALIELFSKGNDRRTLEELDEEAYAMGEENAPYLTSIRNTVEEAMDDIATFARWKMMQDSREEGVQAGIKRGKKAGADEERKKQNRLNEATMREFDRLAKQRTADERRDAEATMRMHDRLIKEVYNEAKSLSAKEKEAIRKEAKAQKDEIIKQRDIIANELKNERKNARMTLNEALKQEERNRKAIERKNNTEQARKQKEVDNERRKERIQIAVQEYKQNKKKTVTGSDEYLFLKNKNARQVADEYRRNVIGYLVNHGQFVETNGEVVLDENGMEIAIHNPKTGEWDISERRNTYTPPWGLTLLAEKEGMDRDLFYTVYSKIADMKTARDKKGNHVYKVKDIVEYIGMLDIGVKQKDFLYFDAARLPYSKKPTFLKGGAIKEKAGNQRGRMIEALDNISIDMFIGATKESEIYNAEKRINASDILEFADIVYGKKDSEGKDDFLNFFVPHTIIYTDKMLETRMYANLLTEKPQNTDTKKTRVIRMYRDFKKNVFAEGEAFERMADKLKNPLLKARYYDAKKALAVANEMIVGDHQRNLAGKKVGKSLKDIFKPVLDADKKAGNSNMMQELTELVNCRHDIYRLQVEKGYTGHSIRECEKIVDRISDKYPELVKVADEIAEYSRNLLAMCVECGRISQAEYDYFQKKYPYYVPTFRVLENKTYDRNGNIVKRNVSVIKTAVGGYDDVLPLFDQLVRRTQEIVKVCKKNQLATEIAKSFQFENGAEFIDDVIRTKDRKAKEGVETPKEETEDKIDFLGTSDSVEENIIPWYSAGEQYDIFVSDEHLLYGWDRILPKWSEEGWKVILRRLNAFKRAVLTQYNPTFFIKNHIKDTHDLFLYNQHAQRLPVYYLKAWEMMVGSAVNTKNRKAAKKDYLNEYLSLGMSMTSVFEYDQTNPARKLKRNKVKKVVMKPFDGIDYLNFIVEQVPRLAVYMETTDRLTKERSKGENTYTDEEIRSISGYQASDATLNFGRSGTVVKNLNTYGCTFLNAGVQGMDRARRAVTQIKDGNKRAIIVNILGLIFKAILVGVGSGWITDWIFGGDDEYAEAIREKLFGKDSEKVMQEYAEMTDYQRLNYLLLNIDGKWIRIPRGRVASFIYSFDYNGEKLRNNEMDLLDLLVAQAEMAADTILPPNPINENILSAFLDVQKNRDAWGEPIVEDYEDKGKGFHYLEYDDNTSDLAIAIADFGHRITADKDTGASRILDLSPKKLDYTIEQIFGSWHDFVRPFMDRDVKFADAVDSVIGLAKQFYIDPTMSNRLAGDYYDLKEEFENVANANENDSPYAVAYKVFGDYSEPLKALREEIKAVDADDSLSKKEKLSRISELKGEMNDLYRQGIADAKDALAFAMENYYGAEENSDTYKDWEKLTKGSEWQISNLSDSGQAKWKASEEAGVDPDNFIAAYNFVENATADKDENGKSINGSKKAKIVKYLNSLDLTAEQKLTLYFELGEYSPNGDIPAFSNGSVGQSGLSANMASPVAGGGRISSGYGYRDTGIPGASKYHQAVDIAAPAGTDVGASLTGTVTRVSSSGGYGNSVEITSTDENGNTIVTKYSHLLNFGVEVGDVVSQGTKIGEVGSTGGVSSGNHLDFKLGINGEWVDPLQYVDLAGAGIVDTRGYTQKTSTGGNSAISVGGSSSGGYRGNASGGSKKTSSIAITPRNETKYDSIVKTGSSYKPAKGNSSVSARGNSSYTGREIVLPTASEIASFSSRNVTGRSTKAPTYGMAGAYLPKASDYGTHQIKTRVATTKRTGRTGGSFWDPNVLS